MRLAPIGWKIVTPLFVLAALCFAFGWNVAAGIFVIAGLYVLYFFRDPERIPPEVPGALVSPADGKVDTVEVVDYAGFPGDRAIKVGIFLSIFDVHINRAPCDGRVVETKYKPGKFLNAMNKKSSIANESNLISLETNEGPVLVKQIAGMIARRIICPLQRGNAVKRGQRIGLICFGSRTEAFLPTETELKVKPGMHVIGGSTIIGILATSGCSHTHN